MQDDESHDRQLRDDEEAPPIRLSPDDLAPETLRAVIESFVLREGTDYGARETSLDDKVAQVLAQLQRREAYVVYEPASDTVSIVTARTLRGHGDGHDD